MGIVTELNYKPEKKGTPCEGSRRAIKKGNKSQQWVCQGYIDAWKAVPNRLRACSSLPSSLKNVVEQDSLREESSQLPKSV